MVVYDCKVDFLVYNRIYTMTDYRFYKGSEQVRGTMQELWRVKVRGTMKRLSELQVYSQKPHGD